MIMFPLQKVVESPIRPKSSFPPPPAAIMLFVLWHRGVFLRGCNTVWGEGGILNCYFLKIVEMFQDFLSLIEDNFFFDSEWP